MKTNTPYMNPMGYVGFHKHNSTLQGHLLWWSSFCLRIRWAVAATKVPALLRWRHVDGGRVAGCLNFLRSFLWKGLLPFSKLTWHLNNIISLVIFFDIIYFYHYKLEMIPFDSYFGLKDNQLDSKKGGESLHFGPGYSWQNFLSWPCWRWGTWGDFETANGGEKNENRAITWCLFVQGDFVRIGFHGMKITIKPSCWMYFLFFNVPFLLGKKKNITPCQAWNVKWCSSQPLFGDANIGRHSYSKSWRTKTNSLTYEWSCSHCKWNGLING